MFQQNMKEYKIMHELEMNEKNEAMMAYASSAGTPWHGLGSEVPDDLTAEQFMKKAGLDWEVEKRDMFINSFGSDQKIEGRAALVRKSDEKILDVIGKNWEPVQNHEAFNFFEDYIKAGDMSMHTAGSLKGGRMTWALAKTNEAFELHDGDVTENFFLFTNPHQYGKSITIRMTPIRVVCQNTLTLSLSQDKKSDQMVTLNHRTPFVAADVKDHLGIAREKMAEYKEMAQFLSSVRYTKQDAMQYFNEVYGKKSTERMRWGTTSRNAANALDVMHTQPGAQFGEGTYWQLFNTVTYMADHLQGRSPDNRMQSSWYGKNRRTKLNALGKALSYANAA